MTDPHPTLTDAHRALLARVLPVMDLVLDHAPARRAAAWARIRAGRILNLAQVGDCLILTVDATDDDALDELVAVITVAQLQAYERLLHAAGPEH